ncbi:Uncharacterised protein [Salmonella enterica subsp. enterica serovar Bovismorbificans]|uniref:Uncharacterized protein n=1 Tax=Salmonella enterica subsp. enterica serovar Bovismorbificans TaxID=58097 RepID=A0A655ECQ5_SALET|nr:Uncharacterised protein [Salmonella enterica subsp. enterica serovar Bovismorbificans]
MIAYEAPWRIFRRESTSTSNRPGKLRMSAQATIAAIMANSKLPIVTLFTTAAPASEPL